MSGMEDGKGKGRKKTHEMGYVFVVGGKCICLTMRCRLQTDKSCVSDDVMISNQECNHCPI